jgi:cell division protein FtsW
MAVESQKPAWDYLLLLVSLCLVGMGLVMVLSASSVLAQEHYGDPYHFFRPQLIFSLVGLGLMVICKNIPYRIYCRLAYPILLVILSALVLVLIPSVGHEAGGARRWLRLAGLSVQPSEAAKLALVFYLAYSLAAKQEKIKDFAYGLFPHLIVLVAMVVSVVAEPDLGTAVILTLIAWIMFFVAGVRVTHLVALALCAVPVVYALISHSPYRMKRISAFLSPWDDPLGAGYHIIHSFMAFASGGLTGLGPGGSQQKLFFLPEPHTDFIFSVVGEELGFIGVALVAVLFLVFVWRGLAVALQAYDLEGTYMALGLTLIIGLQAFMNMAVVVGLLPTKGLALPFFSYGGSAMLVNLTCVGILMNISGQRKPPAPSPSKVKVKGDRRV